MAVICPDWQVPLTYYFPLMRTASPSLRASTVFPHPGKYVPIISGEGRDKGSTSTTFGSHVANMNFTLNKPLSQFDGVGYVSCGLAILRPICGWHGNTSRCLFNITSNDKQIISILLYVEFNHITNLDKSKIMIFKNGNKRGRWESWKLNDKEIEIVNYYNYLGPVSSLSILTHTGV